MTVTHHRRDGGSLVWGSIALLTLSLLLASAASPAAADEGTHKCIHDTLLQKRARSALLPAAQRANRARPSAALQFEYTFRDTDASTTWQSLRITVYTDDVDNASKHCTAVDEVRPDLLGGTLNCTEADVLTAQKRDVLINVMIPEAVQLHMDRLLVQRLSHISIGDSMDPSLCVNESYCDPCGSFTASADVIQNGVNDTDFVLYVAAAPTGGSTVAWATSCAILDNNRPVSGVINVSPEYIDTSAQSIRTVGHEIMHALGFSSYFFNQLGMVRIVKSLRGKSNVPVIVGDNIIQHTGNQYGCDRVVGAEVDDSGGAGTYGSHWHMRNAKDEIMCGYIGPSMRYSALSISAMEDLGFYKGNYSNAEYMQWGFNASCTLLDDKCVIDNVSQVPAMFCVEENKTGCSAARTSVSYCRFREYSADISPPMQYFSDPKRGGYPYPPDYCPMYYDWTGLDRGCSDGNGTLLVGSVISNSSRCVSLADDSALTMPVCVDVQCDAATASYSIRFLNATEYVACTAGSTIDASASSDSFAAGSTIVCPPYREVCATMFSSTAINVTQYGDYVVDTASSSHHSSSDSSSGVRISSSSSSSSSNSSSSSDSFYSGSRGDSAASAATVAAAVSLLALVVACTAM